MKDMKSEKLKYIIRFIALRLLIPSELELMDFVRLITG